MTRRTTVKIVGLCLSAAAMIAAIGDQLAVGGTLLAASVVVSIAAWWPRSASE